MLYYNVMKIYSCLSEGFFFYCLLAGFTKKVNPRLAFAKIAIGDSKLQLAIKNSKRADIGNQKNL